MHHNTTHNTHRISDYEEAHSTKDSTSTRSGMNTPFYMAPEMATASQQLTKPANVYSFGIMAAQVMVGRLVYENEDEYETRYRLPFQLSIVVLYCDFFPFFFQSS